MGLSVVGLVLLVGSACVQGEAERRKAEFPSMGNPEKRQTPPCGANYGLFLGQYYPLVSANYPNNIPVPHSCSWMFSCPVEMTLQCSNFQLPLNLLCLWTGFTYNGKTMCGSSTALQSPVNVGRTLNARLYASVYTGKGFTCTVTCGSRASCSKLERKKKGEIACNDFIEQLFQEFPDSLPTSSDCGVSQYPRKRVESSPPVNSTESGDENPPGNSTDVDRIVGGSVVPSQRKYPWMVWYRTSSVAFWCGGTLIGDRYVLTASHCVHDAPSATYYVTLGDLDRNTPFESGSIVIPAQAIEHPQFVIKKSGNSLLAINNDIALLKLSRPVDFQAYPHIRPICLSMFALPFTGQTVVDAGWGATTPWEGANGITTARLMEVTVNVVSDAVCKNNYPTLFNTNFFCTQGDGKNTCNGDSGGPVMYKTPSGYYQNIGVTSFSKSCSPNYGAAFAKTAIYVNSFIGAYTNDARWCPPPGY
ncbi:unnamed protein product [Darwinula stevensoni]|uniref:Peptidase S1 domain-containing protein n=1 Tax=Darwinula stevensoni TaxID=69355 RepID=A0A7R9A537_9CRUS|nr:unnamed protein product [Darwinula stevensoni]CAG0893628.1 unnamed protein product [Darwinula stevensoni]